jgi:hypothetical protein
VAETLENSRLKLVCPRCALPLRGDETKCPACGKRVSLPESMLVVVLIVVAALAGGGILAAGRIRNGVERAATRPEDAYAAAQGFVLRQPSVRQPAVFAPVDETVIEKWGPAKYRVTGRAQVRDETGRPVKMVYSCVVERDVSAWALEDMSVQVSK